MTGTLYLVGTPIGNLEDITLRAIATLKAVDAIACEDTRETSKLLRHFGIDRPTVSYHEHNKRAAGPRLIARIAAGESIALVSDAGKPGNSDPGEELVAEAVAAGVPVVAIPGPTAFVTALVGSGLPAGRFAYEGFLAREPKMRRRRLRELANETRTMVFYEAPHRIVDTLADMRGQWGDERSAVVARELTKKFEEYQRGTLASLQAHFEATPPKGEIVLLVGGGEVIEGPTGDWRSALKEALDRGDRESDAAKAVAKTFGVNRQEAYDAAVELKGP
jgi:16S rRNA (cytidine1402-2'-O)-methyltransferase